MFPNAYLCTLDHRHSSGLATRPRRPGLQWVARKSTGPCTAPGKRRVVLKALMLGRDSRAFREHLIRASEDVELFDSVSVQVRDCLQPLTPPERTQTERLAQEVWCLARRATCPAGVGTKPESALNSTDARFRLPSRIRVVDPQNGRRLAFWVRGRRIGCQILSV